MNTLRSDPEIATGVPAVWHDRAMRRVGKVLMWLGMIAVVVSLGAGIPIAVIGLSKVSDTSARAFEIRGSATHNLDAGDTLVLYAPGTQSDAAEDAFPSCAVNGPGAQRRQSTSTYSFTYRNTTVRSFAQYSITSGGVYALDCGDSYVVGAPPVSVGGLFSGIGGILLAVFGGVFGLAVAITGLVLWLIGRRRIPPGASPTAPSAPPWPPA
ncbi:hypothetical protein J6U32_08965 [Gordonia polyisoprenivorans]|nr:hypothetical protein J6U32_08965 [Gordonia polyisoprenivorans]